MKRTRQCKGLIAVLVLCDRTVGRLRERYQPTRATECTGRKYEAAERGKAEHVASATLSELGVF